MEERCCDGAMILTIAQRADLRKVVLEFLSLRFPNAYGADSIARMLTRRSVVDYPVTSSDVVEACAYLKGEGLADSEFVDPELDVTPGWSATSKGKQHWERARVADDPAESNI